MYFKTYPVPNEVTPLGVSIFQNSAKTGGGQFLQRSKGQLSLVLLLRGRAWNLYKLASFGNFGFSRPELDGNKLAKGMCLVRKARDREVFI